MKKYLWFMRLFESLVSPIYIMPDEGGSPAVQEGQSEDNSAPVEQGIIDTPPSQDSSSAHPESNWYAGLPEEMHDKFKDMSAEEAAKAFERGQNYQPVESIEGLRIELSENSMIPATAVDGFKEFAVENGLTAEQAANFAKWYEQKDVEGFNASIDAGVSQLKSVFKEDYDSKVKAASETVAILDKRMEGRLSDGVKNGLHSNPAFLEAMALIRPSFNEADVSGGNGSGGEVQAEDPKDFYGKFYKKEN